MVDRYPSIVDSSLLFVAVVQRKSFDQACQVVRQADPFADQGFPCGAVDPGHRDFRRISGSSPASSSGERSGFPSCLGSHRLRGDAYRVACRGESREIPFQAGNPGHRGPSPGDHRDASLAVNQEEVLAGDGGDGTDDKGASFVDS